MPLTLPLSGIQLEKLSLDTWTTFQLKEPPEHDAKEVDVVVHELYPVLTFSLKVIVIEVVTETFVRLSAGETDETVKELLPELLSLLLSPELSLLLSPELVPEASSILLESRPSSLVLSWPQECRNITNRIKKEIVRNELIFINSPIILKFSVPL